MPARTVTGPPTLTDRQIEVARLIRDDLTNGEIADELGISLSGAKHHVQELLRRLELNSREEIGDWYEAGSPSGLRRLRSLISLPLGWLIIGGLSTGAAAAAVVGVVFLVAGVTITGGQSAHPIVFPASGVAGNPDLFIVNADGSGIRNLTSDAGKESEPSFSPDGSRIAFEAIRGTDSQQQIYVMNSDGTDVTQLTFREDGVAIFPSWSPDGTRIAFMRATAQRYGPQRLWVMDADGSNQQLLGDGRGGAIWSSDGTQLLMNNVLVAVDGSGRIELADHGGDSHWSPDETLIVFHSDRDAEVGGPHNGAGDLWVMDADGGGMRQLTSAAGRDYRPRWSPDGDSLVFVSDRDGNDEVYILDLLTGAETRLTDNIGIDGGVLWSRDGSQVLFLSNRDGPFALYSMRSDGSDQRMLTASEEAPNLVYFTGLTIGR